MARVLIRFLGSLATVSMHRRFTSECRKMLDARVVTLSNRNRESALAAHQIVVWHVQPAKRKKKAEGVTVSCFNSFLLSVIRWLPCFTTRAKCIISAEALEDGDGSYRCHYSVIYESESESEFVPPLLFSFFLQHHHQHRHESESFYKLSGKSCFETVCDWLLKKKERYLSCFEARLSDGNNGLTKTGPNHEQKQEQKRVR